MTFCLLDVSVFPLYCSLSVNISEDMLYAMLYIYMLYVMFFMSSSIDLCFTSFVHIFNKCSSAGGDDQWYLLSDCSVKQNNLPPRSLSQFINIIARCIVMQPLHSKKLHYAMHRVSPSSCARLYTHSNKTTVVGAVVQLVEYRTRNQEVAGLTHTRSAASNIEQVQ